ncbi:MAG: hypothetical protein LBU32_28665 [Clostridiales bacterium]|nr:hypothetical protein [Clostridiales bacterium]
MRPADSALPRLAALRQRHSKALHACGAVPARQGCPAASRRARSRGRRPGAPVYSWAAQLPSGSLGWPIRTCSCKPPPQITKGFNFEILGGGLLAKQRKLSGSDFHRPLTVYTILKRVCNTESVSFINAC